MRLHRRALHPGPEPGGCQQDPFSPGCSPPLPTVPSTYNPGPGLAPSPPPSMLPPWLTACPPPVFVAPAPAPAPAPVNTGRRDQGGTYGYGPPPPVGGGGADDHRRNFVTYALIAAGVIAFLSLILLGVSVAVRRRQVRRRRQALLAPAAPSNADDGGGNGPEGGGGAGVVHHIWYIRTVGLDEAAINSIAVTQYRAGAGLLGAADCSVCLGEFQDGERVRLLPKCGHTFHVPCIDTWLRAHVNCPLCRSDVLDDDDAAAESGESSGSSDPPSDPDANANDAADQAAAAGDAAPDHGHEAEEEESDGRDAPPAEENQQGQSSCPEPSPLAYPLPRNVRRAASMDAVTVSTAADVAALDQLPEATPEEEQEIGGGRKRETGPSFAKASGSGHRGNNLSTDRPAPGGVPRSFFSRHCRARSSVLPL